MNDSPYASSIRDAPSAVYCWYAIGLLSLVNVFSYMDRMALAVLAPFIKADFQLTDAQLGLLTGLAFSLFYAVCGLPIARWADRGVRRDIIVLALAVWSVMTALSGTVQNFLQLFAARMGVGAGEAGSSPAAQSMICDYVPLEQRSGAFAVYNFGGFAGLMLGMILAGWLGEKIGWRWTFVALGLPGIAWAAAVRLMLREPSRGRFDATSAADVRPAFGSVLTTLWRCRTYMLLLGAFVVFSFCQYGLNQWWPSFYRREFGIGLSKIGLYLGVSLGISTALGLLIGGVLANKLAQRNIRLPLICGAAGLVLAFPAAVASLFVSSMLFSVALVSLATVLWSISSGPIIASITAVIAPSVRATSISITAFAASLLGYGLGPFCVGLLSDSLTPSLGVHSLRYALIVPTCILPVMALLVYMAARTLPRDLKATTHTSKIQYNRGRA